MCRCWVFALKTPLLVFEIVSVNFRVGELSQSHFTYFLECEKEVVAALELIKQVTQTK